VGGTAQILKLATQKKLKPVHHVSTLSILINAKNQVDEDCDIDQLSNYSGNGYSSSKWVAEKLVKIAQQRGVPCTIYRLGQITGHSQTGVGKPDDFLYSMWTGCYQISSFPAEIKDYEIQLTPVDYAVSSLVYLSQQPAHLGKTFHLINPIHML